MVVRMTGKVTISLPDELLERVDAEATALGVPRSELVRESLASYLARSRDERATDERRRRVLETVEGMRTFASDDQLHDERPSGEILREVRATDDEAALDDPWREPTFEDQP
jgi:metal-responsive CopG/Arc/MetJ family transcriptional regulator